MNRAGKLPLQFGYFTLKGSVLAGVLVLQKIKLRAKSAVPHQKDEGCDGSRDQNDRDQKKQQHNLGGHWASLGVPDSLFHLRTRLERNLALCFLNSSCE